MSCLQSLACSFALCRSSRSFFLSELNYRFLPPSFSSSVNKMPLLKRRLLCSCSMTRVERLSSEAALKQQHRIIHPNIWDDNFLQSLNSPFSETAYLQHAQNLIKDIKKLLNKAFREADRNADLIQRLSLVDSLMQLGISRHFYQEITEALDYVFRIWIDRKGCLGFGDHSDKRDLGSTALAFRLLRLHRYGISSECFAKFKARYGDFSDIGGSEIKGDEEDRIRSLLSLLRASNLQFPGESILQEAETSASKLLNAWLSKRSHNIHMVGLVDEIKHALKYPWHLSPPRWEARNAIAFFEKRCKWLREETNQKILELAKLDFNTVQAYHQKEVKSLSRWWKESKVSKLSICRHRPIEAYFLGAAGIFEPEFSWTRLAVGKTVKMGYIFDDMFDTYATPVETSVLTEAFQRLDTSLTGNIREPIRICFEFVLQAAFEVGDLCDQKAGKNVKQFVLQRWQQMAKRCQREMVWSVVGYKPTLEEYLENASESVAVFPLFVTAKLLTCSNYPIEILKRLGKGMTKFEYLCGQNCKLIDDIEDFEEEQKHGEEISAVTCYMKDNPKCSKEDALNNLRTLWRESMRQLTKLYLDPQNENEGEAEEPILSKRATFEMTRAFCFFYSHTDGFTFSDKALKNQIQLLLFNQVPFLDV